MTKLTREDVLKLARLARIELSEAEIESFTSEFNAILTFVEQLQSVDVDGLAPTSQVTGLTNVMRDDTEIDYGYTPTDLLANAPATEGHLLKVKRMIG